MTFTIHAPQAVYVAISILGMSLAVKQHGKERSPENAWTKLISVVITYALLIWGGFFR